MPVTSVPLRPEKVNLDYLFPENAEENLLKHGFAEHLRGKLVAQFLAESFDSQAACAEMCDEMRSKQREALRDAILYERSRRRGNLEFGVHLTKLDAIAEEGDDEQIDEEVNSLELPDEFVSGVETAIQQSVKIFEELEQVHQHPDFGAEVVRLLQELQVLAVSIDQDGIDEIYRYISEKANNSQLVIPHSEASALYFITYLPIRLRYPVQELLVFSAYIDQLQSMMEGADNGEQQFLEQVIKHEQLGMVLNSHWDMLIDWHGCSQDTIGQMGKLRLEDTAALAAISSGVKENPKLKKLLQRHMNYCKGLYVDITELDEEKGVSLFQSTDIGHCFVGAGKELYGCLYENKSLKVGKPKNGQFAVILEDDPRQMEDWQHTIESNSPYTLLPDGGSSFASPDALVDTSDNGQVGFYLLDIENSEDRTAGIEVAKSLLDRLVSMFREHPSPRSEDEGNVNIVVWSRSQKLVKEAERVLKTYIAQSKYRDVVEGFGYSCAGASVKVEVMLKSERPF